MAEKPDFEQFTPPVSARRQILELRREGAGFQSPEDEAAQVTQEYCPTCPGLKECRQRATGYMVFHHDGEDEPYPWYGYQPCPHLLMHQVDAVLGPKFARRQFGTFRETSENREALFGARQYVKSYQPGERGKGLLFVGSPGTGKTHLAASVFREVVRKGETDFQWVFVPGKEPGDLRNYAEVHFLVLDDITGTGWDSRSIRPLYALINTRYEQDLPTLFTSNMTGEQMAKMLGSDLADRIREMCQILVLGGQSWRGLPLEEDEA